MRVPAGPHSRLPRPRLRRAPGPQPPPRAAQPERGRVCFSRAATCTHPSASQTAPRLPDLGDTSGNDTVTGRTPPVLQDSPPQAHPSLPASPLPGGASPHPRSRWKFLGLQSRFQRLELGKDASVSLVTTRGGGVGVQMPRGHSQKSPTPGGSRSSAEPPRLRRPRRRSYLFIFNPGT